MSGISWNTLTLQTEGEKVENFLVDADVASVIFDLDASIIKLALFATMAKFEKFAGVQMRCFELLQDCHLLSPPGITNDELVPRYDAILRTLSSWISKPEIVQNILQLLSMVADRDIIKQRSIRTEEHELLFYINKAISLHHNIKPLQRAALQLFEAIIENAPKQSFAPISSRIFKPVLDNLLLNGDDTSICYSSFSILDKLAGHASAIIAPWTDQIINLSLNTIARQCSGEVTSKCLLLLRQMTSEKDALLTVAGHERGLFLFVDALATLRPTHLPAQAINLDLFLRIIEDYDIATVAFQSIGEQDPLEYALKLQSSLKEKFDKFVKLCADEDNLDEHAMEDIFVLYSQVDQTLEEMINDVPPDEHDANSKGPDDHEEGAAPMEPEPMAVHSEAALLVAVEGEEDMTDELPSAEIQINPNSGVLVANFVQEEPEVGAVAEEVAPASALPTSGSRFPLSNRQGQDMHPDDRLFVDDCRVESEIQGSERLFTVQECDELLDQNSDERLHWEGAEQRMENVQQHWASAHEEDDEQQRWDDGEHEVDDGQQHFDGEEVVHDEEEERYLGDRQHDDVEEEEEQHFADMHEEEEQHWEDELHEADDEQRQYHLEDELHDGGEENEQEEHSMEDGLHAELVEESDGRDVEYDGYVNEEYHAIEDERTGKEVALRGEAEEDIIQVSAVRSLDHEEMLEHAHPGRPLTATSVMESCSADQLRASVKMPLDAERVDIELRSHTSAPTIANRRDEFVPFKSHRDSEVIEGGPVKLAVEAASSPAPSQAVVSPQLKVVKVTPSFPSAREQEYKVKIKQLQLEHARRVNDLKKEKEHVERALKSSNSKLLASQSRVEQLTAALKGSQEQTVRALEKAEAMHRMFRDAAMKIEALVEENERVWIKLQELQDLREEEVEEMEEEIAERAPSPISNAGNNLDLSMDDLSAAFTEPPKPSPADSIPLTLLSPLEVGPRPLAASLRDASAVTNRRFSPTKMPSKRTPKRARADRSKLVVDSKFSVAVAGVLEALEQVAGVNPAPPGSSLFSRVESVAEINMALFNHLLSRQRMPVAVESSGDMQSSSLPIRSLRSSLEAMGLVPQIAECSSPHALTGGARRRMELLLAQFRVKHVSLFGMAFTVVLCALERLSPPSLPNSPSPRGGSPSPVPISSEWLPDLLQKIEAILSKYLSSLRSQMESEDAVNPLDADPTLDQYEFDDVVRILEREKKPLLALFAAYTPWVSSSSAVRGLNTPQKDLPSAAAASQCGRRAGWRISQSQYCERFLGAGPAGNLMRWHDALTFAKEFAICPSMLSFSQFNEIFHSVAAGEAVTNTAPSLLALSFVQFVDLMFQCAVRCPLFRDSNASAPTRIAKFFVLLNQSPGRTRLARRSRSSEVINFRPHECAPVNRTANFVRNGQLPVATAVPVVATPALSPLPVMASASSSGPNSVNPRRRKKTIEELREWIAGGRS